MKTNVKLISVTWSYDDNIDLSNSFLLKSFLKKNSIDNFINIHFNRNLYLNLENEFNAKFGYQYEFLLYRIFLLKDKLNTIDCDNIIFADTGDVACLKDIQAISPLFKDDMVIFGSEGHRYPNESNITDWTPSYKYFDVNDQNMNYLNAGISYGKKHLFIKLYDECIRNIFPKEYKNFGGDQGIFTYYYINLNTGLIELDNTQYILNTYSKSYECYSDKFFFIHDNGWNYGSPKFIDKFNLV